MNEISALLQQTSRTIALTIPLLPEPTGTEVSVASLLFGVMGTLEKGTDWSSARRVDARTALVELLDGPPEAANATVSEWTRDMPMTPARDRKLLEEIPSILRAFQQLRTDARVSIRRHIARSVDETGMFLSRSDGPNELEFGTLQDLRRYCDAALRAGGAEPGLVAFNAFVTNLALANLAILRDYGPGSGLSRLEVAKIALDVAERMARPRSGVRAPLADSPPHVAT